MQARTSTNSYTRDFHVNKRFPERPSLVTCCGASPHNKTLGLLNGALSEDAVNKAHVQVNKCPVTSNCSRSVSWRLYSERDSLLVLRLLCNMTGSVPVRRGTGAREVKILNEFRAAKFGVNGIVLRGVPRGVRYPHLASINMKLDFERLTDTFDVRNYK